MMDKLGFFAFLMYLDFYSGFEWKQDKAASPSV
jgi:hypothetical protein